jgi:type VI secretion system protein ImpE
VALIPTRYPGSAASADGLIVLARKTVWEEIAPDTHRGLGQRVLTTDTDETPLLEARTITLTGSEEETTDPAADHG